MNHEETIPGPEVDTVVAKMDLWLKELTFLDLSFVFRGHHRVIYRGRLAMPLDGSYGSYIFWVDFDVKNRLPFFCMNLNPAFSADVSLDPQGRMVSFDGIYIMESTLREAADTSGVSYADLLRSGKS